MTIFRVATSTDPWSGKLVRGALETKLAAKRKDDQSKIRAQQAKKAPKSKKAKGKATVFTKARKRPLGLPTHSSSRQVRKGLAK